MSKPLEELAREAAEKIVTESDEVGQMWLKPIAATILHAIETAVGESLDPEQARWQQAIYELCCKYTEQFSAPSIDGGGCDSGDPLDLTLSEITQAICAWRNHADRLKLELEQARKALASISTIGNEIGSGIARRALLDTARQAEAKP